VPVQRTTGGTVQGGSRLTARFTERTLNEHSAHFKHSGQMVEVGEWKKDHFPITVDGWTGGAYPHELSECSPELSLLVAKLRILGNES